MDWRNAFIFSVTVSLILAFAGTGYAQQEGPGSASDIPDVQWLWGEVVSLDSAKGEVVVKFLDYETEEEKQVTIFTDDKTAYENVDSLSQIKTGDTLSVDYVVDKDGKDIAKNISVERPEDIDAPDMSATADLQPPAESTPEETMEAEQPGENSTQDSAAESPEE